MVAGVTSYNRARGFMATHVSLSALLAVTAFISVPSLRWLLSMSTVVTLRQPLQAGHHDHKTSTRTNVRTNSKNTDNSDNSRRP